MVCGASNACFVAQCSADVWETSSLVFLQCRQSTQHGRKYFAFDAHKHTCMHEHIVCTIRSIVFVKKMVVNKQTFYVPYMKVIKKSFIKSMMCNFFLVESVE